MKISIDESRFEVVVNRRKFHLTPSQIKILSMLKKADGRPVSRSKLLKVLWGVSSHEVRKALETRSVDQHISRLREIFGTKKKLIRTIINQGYALIEN